MQIHTPKQRQNHTRNLDIAQLLCYIGFGIGSEYQFAPENLVSRDGFGSPVPRQPTHLHTQAKSGTYLRDYSRFPRRRSFIYLISDIDLLQRQEPRNPIGIRPVHEQVLYLGQDKNKNITRHVLEGCCLFSLNFSP